jgi:hypothetical protein
MDYTRFFKENNSKREIWTFNEQETWLIENGKKVKLISKNKDIYQELISEGVEKE